MLCKLRKVLTVEMNELAAAETLEVEMAAALFLVLDIRRNVQSVCCNHEKNGH